MSGPDAELLSLVEIAERAGARVAELYREHQQHGIAVEEKAPGDPVTRADREANDLICRDLAERFPDAGVVAEEGPVADRALVAEQLARPRVLFVDPLDGTREFVDQNGEFAVMIGLAEGGQALAGVVHRPATNESFAGRIGAGAWARSAAAGSWRSLTVSSCATFSEATLVVSRSHRPAMIEPLRRRLGITELLACGSVGVKIAKLVSGEAELYVHAGLGIKHWDTCAPEAILGAAGGRMTDLHGAALDYTGADLAWRNGLVATNTILHPGVLSAVPWALREAQRVAT